MTSKTNDRRRNFGLSASYWTIIAAADVPRFVELAGGTPGEDVLRLLADRWSGPASFDLERMLRASDIPVERHVW